MKMKLSLASTQQAAAGESRPGLTGLDQVTLDAEREQILELAEVGSGGTASWRRRKHAEARDLLALSLVAPEWRMTVDFLDLREALRAIVRLTVPVPCRPAPGKEIVIAHQAVLGVTYPQKALRTALPGFAFVQILAPHGVYLANVAPDNVQPLCLGATLPPGIRARELVLMSYGALSMQSVMIDALDPAGVLNHEAARWWQLNRERIPLSRTPFLAADESAVSANPAAASADGTAAENSAATETEDGDS